MGRLTIIFLLVFYSISLFAQSSARVNEVNLHDGLKGKIGTVTIVNQTQNDVKINGFLSTYLPVSEVNIDEIVKPGEEKSINVKMNYADFVEFTSLPFKVFAAPGKTVRCTVLSIDPFKVTFSGDLSQENNYYNAYFKVAQSNQSYYQLGNKTEDFNRFPALADSINRINESFLEKYDHPLSSSFKKKEKQRLLYNNAFLKHHVIFSKAFMVGSLINVEPSYYDFDNQLSLKDEGTMLSSEYLWYAVFRLRDLAIKRQKIDSLLSTEMLSVADNLYGNSKLGDVIKMRLLYDIRAKDERKYKRLIAKTAFIDPDTKLILDSVSNAVFSVPYVGKDAPEFKLPDIKGDSIKLSQFKGKQVIINFWAGWCVPCIKEFPNENALYKKYMTTKNLVVINVCLDTPVEQWRELSKRHGLSMINLFADEKHALGLKKRYNVSSLPKSILIDHNSKIKNNNFKRAGQVEVTDL